MGLLTRFGFDKPAPPERGPLGAAAAPPPAPDRPVRGPAPDPSQLRRGNVLAAVVENLRLVLNTKEGYGWFLPGFGLGDYFASPAAGALDALVRELEDNVRRFEPRLGDPRLTTLGRDATWIVCRLVATLEGFPVAIAIRFDVSFGAVCIEVEGDGGR